MVLKEMSPQLIRLIRLVHNLTIDDVAAATHCGKSTVCAIENGRGKIRGSKFELAFYRLFSLNDEKVKEIEALYNAVKVKTLPIPPAKGVNKNN